MQATKLLQHIPKPTSYSAPAPWYKGSWGVMGLGPWKQSGQPNMKMKYLQSIGFCCGLGVWLFRCLFVFFGGEPWGYSQRYDSATGAGKASIWQTDARRNVTIRRNKHLGSNQTQLNHTDQLQLFTRCIKCTSIYRWYHIDYKCASRRPYLNDSWPINHLLIIVNLLVDTCTILYPPTMQFLGLFGNCSFWRVDVNQKPMVLWSRFRRTRGTDRLAKGKWRPWFTRCTLSMVPNLGVKAVKGWYE